MGLFNLFQSKKNQNETAKSTVATTAPVTKDDESATFFVPDSAVPRCGQGKALRFEVWRQAEKRMEEDTKIVFVVQSRSHDQEDVTYELAETDELTIKNRIEALKEQTDKAGKTVGFNKEYIKHRRTFLDQTKKSAVEAGEAKAAQQMKDLFGVAEENHDKALNDITTQLETLAAPGAKRTEKTNGQTVVNDESDGEPSKKRQRLEATA